MTGKTTTIDFGTVFVSSVADTQSLSQQIEKAVQVNGGVIIDEGAYKYKGFSSDRPHRLKVTIELVEA